MTKEEALEKISEYSNAFKNMFPYHNDKEVALAAVKRNGLVLYCCSKELKDDFENFIIKRTALIYGHMKNLI